jgi:hypothetical protein
VNSLIWGERATENWSTALKIWVYLFSKFQLVWWFFLLDYFGKINCSHYIFRSPVGADDHFCSVPRLLLSKSPNGNHSIAGNSRVVLRTSKRRGCRSYLRGNREPIIPRTLGTSVITCVSVYLGSPRKALWKEALQQRSQKRPPTNRHNQYPLI